jgi:two-component system, chemotaxis family, chemotaxis protein CheY
LLPVESKILIADDMPTIRDLVKTQLKALGYKNIIEAVDGEQALNALILHDTTESKVAMVISDWNMPKMSGLEFLKQVRATDQWKSLPFVLLTSETERDQVTEAVMSGVSQYIVKPFAAKGFEEKFRQAWLKHNKK